jgi:hypothetical protein
MEGEVLIYDLTESKAFCLNETSALVWQACDGQKSVTEISNLVSQKLKSSANEDLIWFAIDQLKKERLIENSEELPDNFAGMSRREVIKKVGLGTMIALPIVASLVAPSAAFAQSCRGGTMNVGEACTTDTECISCCCAINETLTTGTCAPFGGLGGPSDVCISACECAAGPCAPNGMAPRMCN